MLLKILPRFWPRITEEVEHGTINLSVLYEEGPVAKEMERRCLIWWHDFVVPSLRTIAVQSPTIQNTLMNLVANLLAVWGQSRRRNGLVVRPLATSLSCRHADWWWEQHGTSGSCAAAECDRSIVGKRILTRVLEKDEKGPLALLQGLIVMLATWRADNKNWQVYERVNVYELCLMMRSKYHMYYIHIIMFFIWGIPKQGAQGSTSPKHLGIGIKFENEMGAVRCRRQALNSVLMLAGICVWYFCPGLICLFWTFNWCIVFNIFH